MEKKTWDNSQYWIRQRLLWRSVHWAVDKALGFRITFTTVQVYQICNHTAFYFSWQCTPFVCPTERTMKIWTLCALVNLWFTVRHWGNSLSCTKSHVPRIEHDKKGAFVICELSKRIDVLLFPLILSKGFRGLKVRQKKWRPYRHTQIRLFGKYAAKLWLFAPNPSLPTKWWEKEVAERVVQLSIYKFSSWNKRQHTVWETGNERHFLQRSGFCYSKGTRVQWALLTFVAILEGQEGSSIERRETKPRWITKTFCVSSACNPNNLWGRNETNELPCVLLLSSHTRGKKI
jgi:hypothetical protein